MRMIESWVVYSLITLVSFFFLNFLIKFVPGENPLMVSFIEFSAAAAAVGILSLANKSFSITLRGAAISTLIGISLAIGMFFLIKGITLAPNPGYPVAISGACAVLVTIASYFVFHSPLSVQKVIGVVTTIIGVILLSI